MKPGGKETLTVRLGVCPGAWVRTLVIAVGWPGVPGLKLIARFGAKSAAALAAGMRTAAHARSPSTGALRDRMTREASMLSLRLSVDWGKAENMGNWRVGGKKSPHGYAAAPRAHLQRHPAHR